MSGRKPLPPPFLAYTAPFVVFLLFLALEQGISSLGAESGQWWLATPKYWVFPLQTLVCGGLLLYYWRHYQFGPLASGWVGILGGLVILGIWIAPQAVLGFPPRIAGGFDPYSLGTEGATPALMIAARFARLVIVVPLVEEIFWRGFLMRYLIKEDFQKVPFGAYSHLSFFGVAGLFMLVHSQADWPAAFLSGIIFNAIAVKTKSLFACVIAHAVANLGLGMYIMTTRQWGFW